MNGPADMSSGAPDQPRIDELLDRAIQAVNNGDKATARVFAGEVLAVDHANAEAEDLLAAPVDGGEIRRLTIMFADLVDSTALSARVEAEIYRTVVGRYKEQVRQIVDRYEGHIGSTKGDGLLAVFGHPRAHENDARRAVQAGLDITREVARLSEQVRRRFGFEIQVRVGVHRGLVFLDVAQDDVYGLAANMTARVAGLAPPGTVVVSNAIKRLIGGHFELEVLPAQVVKGIEEPVDHHRVVGERLSTARIPLGPMVGRQHEVSYLKTSWGQAEAGTLQTPGVAFIGEPGIGKSRLASAAADLAGLSGGVVLALNGSALHTNAGLYPVRALLENRCGIARLTEQVERLRLLNVELHKHSVDPATAIPLLAPVLGIAPEHGYRAVHAEGRKLYDRIAEAICDYLLACLGDVPGLLLVDDVHWFDTASLEIVGSLVDAHLGRLLVVMTGRDDAKLPRAASVDVFDLKPLTDPQTDELIVALDPGLSPNERRAIRDRCDGIPLYVEQVVAGHSQATGTRQEWERVPDALYEPLFARLRGSANAVPVVAAAATIGREVDRRLLLSVVDISAHDVDDVIVELEEALVFEPLADDSWRFRHELLREVASELPPPTQRRLLHGRVADALVGSGAGQPDWNLIALHFEHAERFDEAASACLSASNGARRRGALVEARGDLTLAIEHIGQLPPGPARDRREMAARLRRGFLISATAGPTNQEATADFERCLQLSGTDHTVEVMATLTALFGYYMYRGDVRRAVRILESSRVGLTGGPEWLQPANEVGFATASWYSGDFTTARAHLESLATAHGDVDTQAIESEWFMPHEPIASIYTVLALARFIHGDLGGTEAGLADARRRCEKLGYPHGPFSLAYAQSMEIWMRSEAGQFDEARERAEDLLRLGKRYGFDAWLLFGAVLRAVVDALSALNAETIDQAELKGHIATMTGCIQTMTALEVKPFLSVYYALLAKLLMAAGKPAEACERLDDALKLADETGVHFYDAELLRLRAHARGGADGHDDLRAAIEIARRQGAIIFQLRSAADDFELRYEPVGARQALLDALDRFPDGSTWPELARARVLLG